MFLLYTFLSFVSRCLSILFRDVLKTMQIDVVIIPTQWRAKDIACEMQREGIVAKRILVEHCGSRAKQTHNLTPNAVYCNSSCYVTRNTDYSTTKKDTQTEKTVERRRKKKDEKQCVRQE